MVPQEVYLTFPDEEKKLWHSHEYEVSSGMLILPKPHGPTDEEWEATELEAMKEITNLYGKTWHFWEIDAGHQYPFGQPMLMGSVTRPAQIDLDLAMKQRNDTFAVDHRKKAEARKGIPEPDIHPRE
jgi:hypothetical protein